MEYTCIRCGKKFEAKRKTAVCEDCHTAICVVCGKEFQLQTPWTQKTCSAKCRGIYRKESGISKAVAEKAKNTLLKKYGVSNASEFQHITKKCKYCGKEFVAASARQIYCNDRHYGNCPVCGKTVEIKEMSIGPQACSEECRMKRIEQTCLERYGDTCAVNSESAREKSKQTCIEKYGVDHYSKTKEFHTKFQETMIDRYGVSNPLKSPEILGKLRNTCIERYGVEYHCMTPECRNSYVTISKINKAFADFLDGHSISYEMEFPIERYSYDFKVGDILIEIDPTITHNTELSIFPTTPPLKSDYHKKKSDTAIQHGYRCIHIFDWDSWEDVVSIMLPKNKIYARNCEIRPVEESEAISFINANHISKSCRGQSVFYGLYFNGQLVQIMTFGKPRYNRHYDLELLRLCTLKGTQVIGGASKLFKSFLKQNPDVSVISYCDASKFNGSVYEKMGMQFLRHTNPNRIWSYKNQKITQNLLNSRGFDQLFNTDYGKGTSNNELMLTQGWLPVYDCGQYVYEYKTKDTSD